MATEAAHPKSSGESPGPPPSPLGAGGVDHISGLPDAILGEIISLLPVKEAASTQALASRWRHLWRSAPLSIDGDDLPDEGEISRAGLISRILVTRRGPAARRFSVSALQLLLCSSAVGSWISSPALDKLQELEFQIGEMMRLHSPDLPLPDSTFRFSATLRLLTVSKCHIPQGNVEALHFPQLRELALESKLMAP
nr:unnamed protein product [Digitaria exilis]